MSSKQELQEKILRVEAELSDLRMQWTKADSGQRVDIKRKGEWLKEQKESLQSDIAFYERIEKAKQNAKEVGMKGKGVK